MFELPDYCRTYIGHIVPGTLWKQNELVKILIQKINEAGDAVIMYDEITMEQDCYIPDGMVKEDVFKDIDRTLALYKMEGRI